MEKKLTDEFRDIRTKAWLSFSLLLIFFIAVLSKWIIHSRDWVLVIDYSCGITAVLTALTCWILEDGKTYLKMVMTMTLLLLITFAAKYCWPGSYPIIFYICAYFVLATAGHFVFKWQYSGDINQEKIFRIRFSEIEEKTIYTGFTLGRAIAWVARIVLALQLIGAILFWSNQYIHALAVEVIPGKNTLGFLLLGGFLVMGVSLSVDINLRNDELKFSESWD